MYAQLYRSVRELVAEDFQVDGGLSARLCRGWPGGTWVLNLGIAVPCRAVPCLGELLGRLSLPVGRWSFDRVFVVGGLLLFRVCSGVQRGKLGAGGN